jgi:hypothetical protein
MNPWPFADPKNLAVLSTVGVMRGQEPICLVTHDSDGSWQFLSGGVVLVAEALVVGLDEAVALDASLRELADLPIDCR